MTVSPDGSEWDFTGRDELEQLLDEHGLDREDICLVGSISLSARGLREHDDLDIAIHPDKRKEINLDAITGFVTVVEERYENIDLSDEELIEDETYHDLIDGFKIVRPEIAFSYKKLRDLPKDERDVERLEQYAMSTDDWNWDLYRSDYSQRPNSLLSRGIQSLSSDGVVVTIQKIVGLVTRKYPIINRTISRLPVFDLRTPYETVSGQKRSVSTAQLLNRQYAGDRFVGLDVVAYWTALEAYKSGESPPFRPAKLDQSIDRLSQLPPEDIEPLRLTQRHRVLRPDHLARLIQTGRDTVEVTFTFESKDGGDEPWLRSRGFDSEAIASIEKRRTALLDQEGALFYAIFWPLAHEFHDEMERELAKKVSVVGSEETEIADMEGFVHAIYDAQTDSSPDWAIDWKAELMTEFPNRIRVLKIELPNPRLHDGISSEMEMVKNDVRHAFMDEFPDKYYLSLLHATDSFEDNLKAKAVIDSFS